MRKRAWFVFLINTASYLAGCEDHPLKWQYLTDEDKLTVVDSSTGLVWLKHSPGRLEWADANSYCDSLEVGRYTDWRLPMIIELREIDSYVSTMVTNVFVSYDSSSNYWSSSFESNSLDDAGDEFYFIWKFNDDTFEGYSEKRPQGVLCVHDSLDDPIAEITDEEQHTVVDENTNLVWLRNSPGSSEWTDALFYCDSLEVGKYTDWRLPMIDEFEEIKPYAPTLLPGLDNSDCYFGYWSSSVNDKIIDKGTTYYVYYIWNSCDDSPGGLAENSTQGVLCVHDSLDAPITDVTKVSEPTSLLLWERELKNAGKEIEFEDFEPPAPSNEDFTAEGINIDNGSIYISPGNGNGWGYWGAVTISFVEPGKESSTGVTAVSLDPAAVGGTRVTVYGEGDEILVEKDVEFPAFFGIVSPTPIFRVVVDRTDEGGVTYFDDLRYAF